MPLQLESSFYHQALYLLLEEEYARTGYNPEIFEHTLADGTRRSPVIEGMLDGAPAIGEKEKYRVPQFTALKLGRGWRFRPRSNALVMWHAHEQLRAMVACNRVRIMCFLEAHQR